MGLCWYCYWGWPRPVADIYRNAMGKLDGDDSPLLYGPSHVVWADENFHSAEWCLEHFDEYKEDYSDDDLAIVKQSLEELAALPIEVRCVEPEDYDDEHPELYPPPDEIEMIKGI